MIFGCIKNNGKFRIESRFDEYVKKLKDGAYHIELITANRTNQQNRYYWLYLRLIGSEIGDNPNSLHEYFKRILLTPRFITVMGKELKIPGSTRDLNKQEFGEYIDKIEVITGIAIPDYGELSENIS